jgi:hypothetical protein
MGPSMNSSIQLSDQANMFSSVDFELKLEGQGASVEARLHLRWHNRFALVGSSFISREALLIFSIQDI